MTTSDKAPQAPSPKVGFVSLGCPKALVDSERILTQLRMEGYEVVPTINKLRKAGAFEAVVISKEWHPAEHCSFYQTVTGKRIKLRPPSASAA